MTLVELSDITSSFSYIMGL